VNCWSECSKADYEANVGQTRFEVAIELGKWFRSSLKALFSSRHHLAAFPRGD
jgi:hypothetical protein